MWINQHPDLTVAIAVTGFQDDAERRGGFGQLYAVDLYFLQRPYLTTSAAVTLSPNAKVVLVGTATGP